jgi:hypothetical protein
MSKNRYINTKFWSDNYIVELDPLERYLFLYFLTNEHTNIAGIYELPIRVMAFETGLDKEMLEKMLPRFEGKIFYIKGWIYIKNFAKHQKATSEKVKIGVDNVLSEVPSEIMAKISQIDIKYKDSIDRVCIESELSKSKSISKPISKYTSKDLKLAELLYQLIKENNPAWYVNPNWNQWADDIRKIREIDNRTYEQIEFMINWCQQDDFWKQNILSPAKLRKQFNNLVVKAKQNKNKGVVKI